MVKRAGLELSSIDKSSTVSYYASTHLTLLLAIAAIATIIPHIRKTGQPWRKLLGHTDHAYAGKANGHQSIHANTNGAVPSLLTNQSPAREVGMSFRKEAASRASSTFIGILFQ